MNKNEAQLKEDYGSNAVGNLAGVAVVKPEDGLTDDGIYNLVYDETNDKFTLTTDTTLAGVEVELPVGGLTDGKTYLLVYNSTKKALVLTESV